MQLRMSMFSSLVRSNLLVRKVFTIPVISARSITMDSEESSKKIKKMKQDMFNMYENAVSSVKPGKLVSEAITKCEDNSFIINGRKYVLKNNVFVVGFGKAILDMALEVNRILGDHIIQGILSIPVGSQLPPEVEEIKKRNIQVREGAPSNLPDKNAECTARDIADLADSLKEGNILFVLISGGGSSLLPAPVPGVTIEDTAQVIYQLQSKGAAINEVNSVRKKLCNLKGGKLAIKAQPAHVISLILSDVIGDPLDIIASGPTVENTDPPNLPVEIIKKYELEKELTGNVLQALLKLDNPINFPQDNVFNVLIGSNKTALEAAKETALKAKYFPLILSDKIDFPVADLSDWYTSLCIKFYKAQKTGNYEELKIFLEESIKTFGFSSDIKETLLEFVSKFQEKDVKGLCIIGGGEPTVKVKKTCDSKGGRSQELALRFSVKIHEQSHEQLCEDMICILMAAGTDGIDGPTDAAGAFGYSEQIVLANRKGLAPIDFIEKSNSYGYFSLLPDDIIKIGHTGTNVMDLHVILIEQI